MRGIDTRCLGLDIGDKRIGVAVSDPGGVIASPLVIIERTGEKQDIDAVIDIAREHGAGRIIAGLPLSLDGGIGHQAEKVRSFVDKLASQTIIPVEYRDESLTTASAKSLMRLTRGRKKRRKEKDDAIAAAYILQGYLDENTER